MSPTRRQQLLSSGLILALQLSAAPLLAAPLSNEEPSWYEVELLIVSQPESALDKELWDPNIKPIPLAAPALKLYTPVAETDTQASDQLPTESLPLTSAAVISLESPERVSEAQASVTTQQNPLLIDYHSQPERFSHGAFTRVTDTRATDNSDQPTVSDHNDQAPPWNLDAMMRRGYQPLFQARWRQPMTGREDALPIWVESEQRLSDGAPALQGTLTFYLSRYLHLRSDLYYAQELPIGWISMRPAAAVSEAPLSDSTASSAEASLPLPASGAILSNTDVLDTTELMSPSATAASFAIAPPETGPIADGSHSELLMPTQPNTLTVRFSQNRRMRSNELHYLDHPMIGVLVRIRSYEPKIDNETTAALTENSAINPASQAIRGTP